MKKNILLLMLLTLTWAQGYTQGITSTDGTFSSAPGTDLLLRTNITPRLSILNANGYVGIGKTNPSYPLDVNGAVNAIAFSVNGQTLVSSQWATSGTMVYYNGGNVGIGVAAPAEALHVNGNVLSNQFSASGGSFNATGASNLNLLTNGTSRFTIQSTNGNIGIGTATPAEKLHITGGNLLLDNGNTPTIFTGAGSTELNRYLQLVNAPGAQSSSGLKAGGILIADNYSYGNPTKNDLIVKGRVAIGTPLSSNPNDYSLAVNGKIGARNVQVETKSTTWPDYVFTPAYTLPTLQEVEHYITENNHLKDVPSAQDIEQKHDLGDMDAVLLKKVEELTLYIIQQQKEIDALKKAMGESPEVRKKRKR